MDTAQAWSVTTLNAKSAGRVVAETTTSALDELTRAFVPFARTWDDEADRRNKLRTPENLKALMDAQKANNSAQNIAVQTANVRKNVKERNKNPISTERRAARTADRAARTAKKETRKELKAAKKNYPATLRSRAIQLHMAHALPATAASYVLSTPNDWTMWPASVSASLIGLNAAALWLGRRSLVVAIDDDGLSAEERRLMERLDPSYWVERAEERGLSGTLTEYPEVTSAGIVCGVRLDFKWSAKKLAAEADAVRALLGMKTETQMQIIRGSHGDRALMVIRTRSAADGVSMVWTPDHEGIGLDEVTGETVDLPLKPGVHILLAGITGMGKSVSWRPLAMRAHLDEEWTAIVLDPKRQEAIGWQHVLRTVGQEPDRAQRMDDIYALVIELTQEMHRRQGVATGAVWEPDGRPENRKLLIIIDEGAAIIRLAKKKEYEDVLDMLEELWSEARSVGFQFVWATQNPTKSGGVPALVKDNMSARLSLTVNAGEHERSIFGETAQQTGWTPSTLSGIPGRAMLQFGKRKSDPLRLWFVTDGMIAALPAEEPWRSPTSHDDPDKPTGAALTLVKTEVPPQAVATTNRDRVAEAVRGGLQTVKDIAEQLGMNKGTVSREVAKLVEAGALSKDKTGKIAEVTHAPAATTATRGAMALLTKGSEA